MDREGGGCRDIHFEAVMLVYISGERWGAMAKGDKGESCMVQVSLGVTGDTVVIMGVAIDAWRSVGQERRW